MSGSVLGTQLYTVRGSLKTSEGTELAFKKIRQIGYEAVQLSSMESLEPHELKYAADNEGLEICGTHMDFERICNDTQNIVAELKLWNCEYLAIGIMPRKFRSSREGFVQFAREASRLGRVFADSGIKLLHHNHDFEFCKFNGTTGLDILLNESDRHALDFELDTYWLQAAGADPAYWIKKVSGRIPLVHFKDMGVKTFMQPVMAEVGEGNLNWPSIIETCKAAGVQWYIVEQDKCERDPFESLSISLKNLQGMGLK